MTCGGESTFVELEELNDHITFGDVSKVQVKKKDKILIQIKNRNNQFTFNIYYVPFYEEIIWIWANYERRDDIQIRNL